MTGVFVTVNTPNSLTYPTVTAFLLSSLRYGVLSLNAPVIVADSAANGKYFIVLFSLKISST